MYNSQGNASEREELHSEFCSVFFVRLISTQRPAGFFLKKEKRPAGLGVGLGVGIGLCADQTGSR